jgi:hypothetical protein
MKMVSSAALVFCTVAVYLSVAQAWVMLDGAGVVFAELGASPDVTVTVLDVVGVNDVWDKSPWPYTVTVSDNEGDPGASTRFSWFGIAVKVHVAVA